MGVGELILTFAVCVSLMSIFITGACLEKETCNIPLNDNLVTKFFLIEPATIWGFGGSNLELQDNFSNSIDSVVTEQGAGATFTGTIAVFLDPIKMVIQFFLFLTPIPFLVLMANLGLPTFLSMIITIPTFILWSIALVDLIRGGDF